MGEKFGPFNYVFKSPQRSSVAVKRLFTYLKEKKLTKMALLDASDGFGKDGVAWLEKAGAGLRHRPWWPRKSFGPKDTDMTAQLTKVKNAEPQALVVWTIGPAGAIVAKNKAQLGIDLPLFQCHGLPDPKYIELAGKASEGDRMPATKLMVVDELPDNDPQKPVIQEFIRLYTDVYGFRQAVPHQHPLRLCLGRHHDRGRRHEAGRAPRPPTCAPPSKRPRATWGCPGSTT